MFTERLSEDPMLTRTIRGLVVLVCGLSLTFGALSTAHAAYPPTGSGNTGGGGGNAGGPGGGGGGGGNGGGSNGGGGGSVGGGYWSNTYIVKGANASKTAKAPFPASPNSPTLRQRCSGSTQWGPWVGGKFVASGTTTSTSGNGGYAYNYLNSLSKECLPPAKYTDRTVQCGWTVGASAKGATGNSRVTPTTKNWPVASTRFKTGGAKSISECPKQMVQTYSWAKEDFGRYELIAKGQVVYCTIRDYYAADYFGNRPKDYIRSCGSPRPYSNDRVRWELFCSGWAMGWSNRSYFEEACGDGTNTPSNHRWSCGIPRNGQPYISGVRMNAAVDVFHDAKKRDIVWRYQPRLTGRVRAVTDKKVRLTYKSGTPFRKGVAQNDPTQHFSTSPKMGQWMDGWAANGSSGQTRFDAQFFKAGMPGSANNLRLLPTWSFTADFLTQTMTSVRVDFRTGEVTVIGKDSYTTQTGTCTGPATNLAIQRARISN